MQAVQIVQGTAVPLDRADVDTDQIIPAEWLKRVERTGFGQGLFSSWRDDRSFVLNIEKAADAAAIVHAVVSLGRGLGMKVTAEGVETADQQLFLRASGVHFMQGYRFGRAVTTAEITERLRSPGVFKPIDVPQALAG